MDTKQEKLAGEFLRAAVSEPWELHSDGTLQTRTGLDDWRIDLVVDARNQLIAGNLHFEKTVADFELILPFSFNIRPDTKLTFQLLQTFEQCAQVLLIYRDRMLG